MSKAHIGRVAGFMVVRVPELNKDAEGRGVFSKLAPCIGGICYGGIDRMPWFEIDELFYNGTLPETLARERKLLRKSNNDFSGIDLCRDLELALELLLYSNSLYNANELIAVVSDKLIELKGGINFDRSRATWLGYDVVALGQQSLLNDGLFAVPAAFPGWEKQINEFGLFSSQDEARAFVNAYEEASSKGKVEEINEDFVSFGYEIDVIEVGRIR